MDLSSCVHQGPGEVTTHSGPLSGLARGGAPKAGSKLFWLAQAGARHHLPVALRVAFQAYCIADASNGADLA